MKRSRGFTLTELLVVIVIVLGLAGLLLPVLWRARMTGLDVKCKNHMRQIGEALRMYRDGYLASTGKELHPRWLRDLYPGHLDTKDVLICPRDPTYGAEGGKPHNAMQQYEEIDEPPCSYMYEFNMAVKCSWFSPGDITLPVYENIGGVLTRKPTATMTDDEFMDLDGNKAFSMWGEVKTAQMRFGDTFINSDPSGALKPTSRWTGWSVTHFPIVRCFWHTDEPDTPDTEKPLIFNLAYQGNFFRSGSEWEKTSQ